MKYCTAILLIFFLTSQALAQWVPSGHEKGSGRYKWDPITVVTGKDLAGNLRQLERDIRNAPQSWTNCVARVDRCVDKELRRFAYRSMSPVIERYKRHLEYDARGKWKSLPNWVMSVASSHYPNINLRNIRYAENVNTIHGAAITWESNIYFPISINLNSRNDLHWMLHEIEHSSQYAGRGGYKNFLSQYLLKSAGQVIERGSFDVHDFIGPEREANSKANSVITYFRNNNENSSSSSRGRAQTTNGYPSGYGMQMCGCYGFNPPVTAPEPRCASGYVRIGQCQGMCNGGTSPYGYICQ